MTTSTTRTDVMNLLISKVKLIQMHPGGRNVYTYILFISASICRCFQMFYACVFIANNTNSLVSMANGLKTLGGNLQGMKQIALFRESHIDFITNNLPKFWNSKETKEVELKCKQITKIFFNMIYVTYTAKIPVPILFNGTYPLIGDYPVFPGSFVLICLLQAFQLAYDSLVAISTDCLFLCMSLFTYAQFKELNKRIKRLGDDKDMMWTEAVTCVQHHVFLIKFVKVYAEMFSPALLIQYCITTSGVCIELFVFTKQTPMDMLGSVCYLLLLLLQLAFYCFSAQLVIDEAMETGEAMYDSLWLEDQKLANTFTISVMRRAQLDLKFSGGGLSEINREAFTNIFKWTLSFYTLMKDMEKIFTVNPNGEEKN